ncbi:PREDICTED: transient receptor potential cation channel protein painless-like [Nicrophorus vespilloides]|uniref:Transient receptor potential cation channel protein painless-like n=1 Tax=Nicrophorus vespilloides TaxID=110193 RepID=A0ABM1MMU2_NICVS|nr:PREDICTED: transient receptor potential cation channel protein painless-like [Nicrophorus vespilloides]
MTSKLQRENSVNHHKELFERVKYNSFSNIKDTLSKYPNIINEINYDYDKTILQIACFDLADTIKNETIQILIDYGADVDDPYGSEEYNALHYAVLGQNPDVLKVILLNTKNVNCLDDENNSPLLLLLKDGEEDKDIVECATLLINANIDVNLTNRKNQTCIYWAAKKQYKEVIKLLLDIPNIDIDNYKDSMNKSARSYLTELGFKVDNFKPMELDIEAQLKQLLIDGDEDIFKSEYELYKSKTNYLDLAVDKNLPKAVDFLLKVGCDPNIKLNTKPIITIAGSRGYHEIFKLLIQNFSIRNLTIPENILSEILKCIDLDPIPKKGIDRNICFKYYMEYVTPVNVNIKDDNGSYPLHYSSRYASSDVTKLLLQKGASLANRDKYNVLSVSEMDFETLKEHFDSCITAKPNEESVKEDLTIVFDYNCLLPTSNEIKFDEEMGKSSGIRKDSKETDVILYMSQSSELRNLLLHPLIASFLYMKWQRISFIFWINLFFYLLFCSSFMLYVYNGTQSFLAIMTILLSVREVFQLIVAFKKYYQNFENYIEMLLIGAVIVLLVTNEPTEETKKQLIGIITILATFELLFLLGNLPSLTTNIVMLRRVSYSFFKIFSFYFIIIMAFAFCFYTIFNKDKDSEFESYSQAFFKTAIMLTGELEAGDIEFDKHPITSHLIFIIFVFCIVIILLNLVNGLAVSDTQEIRNEAKLISLIARTEYVAYAEDILFSIQIPAWIAEYYEKFCICQGNNRTPKDSKTILASRVCLFPYYLHDNQLEVYPNQNGRVKFGNRRDQRCKIVLLDNSTVRSARKMIQIRREKDKEHNQLLESLTNIIKNELMELKNLNHFNSNFKNPKLV